MTGRRRTAVLAVAAVMTLACGSGASGGGPAPSAPPGGAVITADKLAFDRAELVIPSDRPFQLLFENREGAPHNVTLLDAASGAPVFTGEVFSGADSRLYDVPAIPPGAFRFRCDVHPDMSGTVVAQPIAAAQSTDVGTADLATTAIEPAPHPAPAPPPTADGLP